MITLDLSSALQRAGQGEESEKLARSTIEPLQRVAELEPENALRQREHSVAYEHLANALVIQSRFAEAERAYLKSYEISKAISSRSTASHFVNDLFSATFALANVAVQQGHYADAAKWIQLHFEYAMQINSSTMNQLQKNIM
ncbi:MAG: tetratricopeptide repeat protein [Gemmataceae bacterium]